MEATAVMDSNAEADTQEPEKAYFTALEARIIASLMEKHLTTPNNYPLTMNSLTNACNQKSNREPVMNLTEGQIGHTVNVLVERKLVGLEYGERANKITHRICTELDLNRHQQAILTVLMLRTPQTLNDIKTRTTRMADFSELEIQDVMNSLMEREKPLAVLIPKGAGRREDRFSHTLCGEVEIETNSDNKPAMIDAVAIENERMDALEARISAIEEKLGLKIEL